MSAPRGGYQRPTHPASVSGPGQHSQRTDGGPTQPMSTVGGQPYGQATADLNAERVQPLPGQPGPPAPQQGGGDAGPAQMPTYHGKPFDRPSERPNEPITAGMPFGAGPGPEALSAPAPDSVHTGAMTQLLQKFAPTDASGVVAQLLVKAQQDGA